MASNNTGCKTCKSTTKPTSTCIQCSNFSFCDECWSEWPLHEPGCFGYDGKPHEKSNAQVVKRLRDILQPQRTPKAHEDQLQQDDDTTWFGIERDSSNLATFQDYGRFATLMSESKTPGLNDGDRYPQLVSFIGQTGAGKSTIIKMLINHRVSQEPFPSPVTSSSDNDRIPTTGDVHLYADPGSYKGRTPILYADCEGLDGGETVPRGLRHRLLNETTAMVNARPRSPNRSDRRPSSTSRMPNIHTNPLVQTKRKLQKSRFCSSRDIAWADNPERQKRGYAVLELYPRLLYTFSDVVVFVLRNARAFESTVLEKLLEWGQSSIDKSVNQPTLPHAVIVLNATDKVDEREWDVAKATKLFLNDVRGAIRRDPRLGAYAQNWRPHRQINTTEDLLKCYYASITVVRVPASPRYMLIDTQVSKLFDVIQKHCTASLITKKHARMLANADKLQIYLQAAYDHFTLNLHEPFDFVKEALKHSPISRDFGGNILKLALSIKEHCSWIAGSTQMVFDHLGDMIAHCIFLDSVRQGLMGDTVKLLDDAYVQFCKDALRSYLDLYTPCNYVHPKYGRCCNFKNTHNAKGHQNSRGKTIDNGPYVPDLDYPQYEPLWIGQIRRCLTDLQARFNQSSTDSSESQSAAVAHLNGGIRGIVELQVLKAIEKELGSNLRIQHFLDLIVGTSTGGIIALGLGVRNWSVDECIRHFKYLCKEAFQPRELVGIPLLERMAVLNHGSMYKTSPFQAMLQKTFKSKPLFGDTDQDTMAPIKVAPIKVAITTATSVDQHPVVLANYNRLDPADYELPYEFHRPDVMSREFKVWEAARATSAAPPFFKFFTKEDTSATYMDGAFYHNNPVRVAHHEQRLLTDEKPPDILISLGTGKNAEIMKKSAEPATQDNNNQRDSLTGGNLQRLYRIVAERFDYLLECNRIWKDFVAEMAVSDSNSSSSASSLRRRILRINPDLKAKVPRLDAVDQVDVIEDATKRYMRSVPAKTREIAHKLVASTFFFEKEPIKQMESGFQCTGHISCRFGNGSDEMKGLGDFLLRCVRGNFSPYFVIQDDENEPWTIQISDRVLTDMKMRGVFNLGRIALHLSRELSMAHISIVLHIDAYPHSATSQIPISGFPRRLASEDIELKVNTARPPRHSRELSGSHDAAAQQPQAQDPQLAVRNSISGRVLRKFDTLRRPSDQRPATTPGATTGGSTSPQSGRSSLSFPMSSLRLSSSTTAEAGSGQLLADDIVRVGRPTEDNMPFSPADVGQSWRSEASSEERFLFELEG